MMSDAPAQQRPRPTNDRLLRALNRQPTDCAPVWIMRQAGRYLPEYRATRAQAGNFFTLCKTPQLACEVTLQPIVRYPLDAAIVFSDILVIPDAMGLGLSFEAGEGPVFARPVRTEADIRALSEAPLEGLDYVFETVRLLAAELNDKIPLIGFAGSPWTLAAYMVEGGGRMTFAKVKKLMYERPELLERMLETLSASVASYLCEKINAGADCVMIFDTWGGVLAHREYLRFSLAPLQRIVTDIRARNKTAPIILFTKGGGNWLSEMAQTGCDALGLDWTVSLQDARRQVGDRIALQGNLDPSVLLAAEPVVRAETRRVLADYGAGPGHIFNLGHGIYQQTDPDCVAAMIDEVHAYKPASPAA